MNGGREGSYVENLVGVMRLKLRFGVCYESVQVGLGQRGFAREGVSRIMGDA